MSKYSKPHAFEPTNIEVVLSVIVIIAFLVIVGLAFWWMA